MIDIMLDLETMGNKTKPAIIQISAVAFDINSGYILSIFDKHVCLQSSIDAGLDIDKGTLLWWMDQDRNARLNIINGQKESESLIKTLKNFDSWVEDLRTGKDNIDEDIRVWGNGSMADNRWIESAYEAFKIESPIKFWEHSDLRTMVDFGWRKQGTDYKKEQEFEGIKHNAVDDCKHQIKYLVNIYNHK